jgi:hypothetical protein
MEFKELEDNIIAYVNEHKISMDEVKKARSRGDEHTAGLHGRKGDVVPDSMYLKGILDKYLAVDYAIENKYKNTDEYKFLQRDSYESRILDKFLKSEIYDKIDEKDNKKKQQLVMKKLESKHEEYKSNYKVEVNRELIKKEALLKDYEKKQVVAKINDYEVTLDDILKRTTPLYLEQTNPIIIHYEYLDNALDNLIRRAIILQEAIKLGYGENIPEITKEEERKMLIKAYHSIERKNIVISDEDLKNRFEASVRYYIRKYMIVKYGIILKKNSEEINEIKKRLDNGEDFFEIAIKESEDINTKEKGCIQDYTVSASDRIKDICYSLEDGEISDIIKDEGSGNYSIIKRLDARHDDYEELKPVIDDDIRQRRTKIVIMKKAKELFEKAKIIVNNKLITEDDFYKVEDIK